MTCQYRRNDVDDDEEAEHRARHNANVEIMFSLTLRQQQPKTRVVLGNAKRKSEPNDEIEARRGDSILGITVVAVPCFCCCSSICNIFTSVIAATVRRRDVEDVVSRV